MINASPWGTRRSQCERDRRNTHGAGLYFSLERWPCLPQALSHRCRCQKCLCREIRNANSRRRNESARSSSITTTNRRPAKFPIKRRMIPGPPFGRRRALPAQRRRRLPAQKRSDNKSATDRGEYRRAAGAAEKVTGVHRGESDFSTSVSNRAATIFQISGRICGLITKCEQ
jgi:hypothetical protein